MQQNKSWLLPDGIEETLPDDARHLEKLRNRLLDMFVGWGYQLVIPPFIDFLDSLMVGSGHDLELQTFKVTDQVSGEMLGIRADMTPQVARIDAHNLKQEWPTRLCYAGTVLHTRGNPLEKTRSPLQIGAELYGHGGKESDIEVISLMLEMLALSGLLNVHLDLGHVGIYRALANQAGLNEEQEKALFDVLQRKARPELNELMGIYPVTDDLKPVFLKLPELNGGQDTLTQAKTLLAGTNPSALQALAELTTVAEALSIRFPNLDIGYDLAELRGYHYHTGIVFAAFVPSVGREIARGGRYDNIGEKFGRARPATGFSADLKLLSTLSKNALPVEKTEAIFAPSSDDPDLLEKIRDLRADKHTVIQQLPGQTGGAEQMGCTALLVKDHQTWVVKLLS